MLSKIRSSLSNMTRSVTPTLNRARETIAGVAHTFKSRLSTMAKAIDQAANPPALLPYRPENVAWLRGKQEELVTHEPAQDAAVEPEGAPEAEPIDEVTHTLEDSNDAAYDSLLILHEDIEELTSRQALLGRMDSSYEADRQRVRLDLQMKRQELRDRMMPRLGLFADMDITTLHTSLQSRGYRRVDVQDPLHPKLLLALDKAGDYAQNYAGDGSLWVHREVFREALRVGATPEHLHEAASRAIREGNICPILHLEELMTQMGYDFFPAVRTGIMERVCRESDIAPGARFVLKSAQRSRQPRVALAAA